MQALCSFLVKRIFAIPQETALLWLNQVKVQKVISRLCVQIENVRLIMGVG